MKKIISNALNLVIKDIKNQSENKKKNGSTIVILATVIIIGILFANGVLEINQDNLDETLQNLPEPIQEASKSAQLLATETTMVLRDTINARGACRVKTSTKTDS